MILRCLFSDESVQLLQVSPEESIGDVCNKLIEVIGTRGIGQEAHIVYLGSHLPKSRRICDSPISEGSTVHVVLRSLSSPNDQFRAVPDDYSSDLDKVLLKVFFVVSFALLALATRARAAYPEAFDLFSTTILNLLWALWWASVSSAVLSYFRLG